MSSPGRGTWVVAVTGLAGQAVTLVVATVSLAHTAATIGDQDPRMSLQALFDTLLGPLVYGIAAVVVGAFALVLTVALLLGMRPGGRFAGLVTALAAQAPIVGFPAWAVANGEDATLPFLAVFVGGGLVVLGALFPATWRFARLARRAPVDATLPG